MAGRGKKFQLRRRPSTKPSKKKLDLNASSLSLPTQPPFLSPNNNNNKQTDGPLSGNTKAPMDFIADSPPIKVHGSVVASTGSEDPALGCPVEFIDLRGTSKENPAVCKYTGNKFYSEDWAHGSH